MILKVPTDTKTHELTSSIVWFDGDGVLYSVPKDDSLADRTKEQSIEQIKNEMDRFRTITGNKKVCMILESQRNAKPPAKEIRELVARELSSVTKAMAIITTSPVSKMVVNLFFTFKPPDYPMKMFTSAEEAKEWIKQYL